MTCGYCVLSINFKKMKFFTLLVLPNLQIQERVFPIIPRKESITIIFSTANLCSIKTFFIIYFVSI